MTWEDNRRGASTEDGFIIEEGTPMELIPRNIHWHDNYMHSFTEKGVKIANLKKAITIVDSLPEVGDAEVFYRLYPGDETHKAGIYYWDGERYIYDDAPTLVADHNTSPSAHADIRALIQAMSTDMKYKGSVEDADHLPTNAKRGDVYTTLNDGREYVYDGDEWVEIGHKIDVAQTTGTSTEVVMSQKAVTDALAGAGGIKVLTTADYNWPENNPDGIALWTLDEGLYLTGAGAPGTAFKAYTKTTSSVLKSTKVILLIANVGTANKAAWFFGGNPGGGGQGGVLEGGLGYRIGVDGTASVISGNLLTNNNVNNSLDTTYGGYVLDARQGKVLKDLIDALDARVTALEG